MVLKTMLVPMLAGLIGPPETACLRHGGNPVTEELPEYLIRSSIFRNLLIYWGG